MNYIKIKILTVYRPPNLSKSNFIAELNDLIDSLVNNQWMIIIGDCNIDTKDGSSITESYLDSLSCRNFLQGIEDFTRVAYLSDHWTKSCLDSRARVY